MKPPTHLLDGFPEDDRNKWLLLFSIVEEGKNLEQLGKFNIQPTDPHDIFLKSLQQAVLEVDRANGSLQEQVQTLIAYLKKATHEIDDLQDEIKKLKKRKSS